LPSPCLVITGDTLLLQKQPARKAEHGKTRERETGKPPHRAERGKFTDQGDRPPRKARERGADRNSPPEAGMDRYRIEVGHAHGVKPANIVGAIANEAGIDSRDMGRITINDDHSLIDLPKGMPRCTMPKKVGPAQLRITRR
jgi:ATP-dependent RNA helicase DeaD